MSNAWDGVTRIARTLAWHCASRSKKLHMIAAALEPMTKRKATAPFELYCAKCGTRVTIPGPTKMAEISAFLRRHDHPRSLVDVEEGVVVVEAP